MKNTVLKILALVLCAVLLLSFAACGSKSSKTGGNTSSGDTSSAGSSKPALAPAESSAPSSSAASGMTVEEFIQTDAFRSGFNAMAQQSEDGMSWDLSAEGNTLIYTFTLDEMSKADIEGMEDTLADALEGSLDGMSSTFNSLFPLFRAAGVKGEAVIRVVVQTNDGYVIFFKDYTEDGTSSSNSGSGSDRTNITTSTSGMTIEDYINSSAFKKELEEIQDSLEGSGLSVKVTAEGNVLVMTYTMDLAALGLDGDLSAEDKALLGESLQEALEDEADTFIDLVEELVDEGIANPVVRIAYELVDGTVLASMDFKA